MNESERASDQQRFRIFKAKDARADVETTLMQIPPLSPVAAEGARQALAAGLEQGSELKLLFEAPGFSLVHAWFKSGFPLPRHTHNCDCLYYVVGGSLKMGHEELVPGDGFFVGKEVPYTYEPGPAGVEVLEFRATNAFDIKVLANNQLFWDAAVQTARARKEVWIAEKRPSLENQPQHG